MIKFDPVTVNVNVAAPAVIADGEIETNVGTGLLPTAVMVNGNELEVPPPGAGVITVTGAVPAVATRVLLTEAVNCNELMKTVVSGVPFQLIVELPIKFVPFTVNINEAAPAVTLAGESELTAGTGLVAIVPIVNIAAFDVPPPGVPLNTVILAVPALAISEELTVAVNCVALIYVVVSAVPFHFIVELLIKSVPVTVSVKAGSPAVTLAGAIAVITGTGFEVPPVLSTVEVLAQDKIVANNKRADNDLNKFICMA